MIGAVLYCQHTVKKTNLKWIILFRAALLQQSGTDDETDQQLSKDQSTDHQSENDQNDLEKSDHAQPAGTDESAVQMSEGLDELSAMEKHFSRVDKLDNVQQADAQADHEKIEQQVVGNDVGNVQSSVRQADATKNTEEVLPDKNGQHGNEQETVSSDPPARESGHQAGSSGDQPACASPEKPAEQNRVGDAVSGLPESGLPESRLPESGLSERGLPESGLPKSGLPESGLPESSKAAPEFTVAKESTTKVQFSHLDNTGTVPVRTVGTVGYYIRWGTTL